MSKHTPHQFYRHAQLPWAELRVSTQSPHHYRLHMHAEYSLGLIDQGQAVLTHPQGPHTLQAGSMVLIEPQVWHACNPVQVLQWSYRMLYLQADWLHALLDMPTLRFSQRTLNDAPLRQQLHQLCLQLANGSANPQDWSQQLRHLLMSAQTQTNTDSSKGKDTGTHASAHIRTPLVQACPAAQPTAADTAVQSVLAQWHQQPECPLSIQALAQAQGMSTSRFIRQFKAATGVTPGAYRMNVQLNGARRLLAQGATLTDAALAMGFADQSHLQRAFKAHHAATLGCYASALSA